jgi:hypothetical protein
MTDFPAEVWGAMGLIAATAVLAMLYLLATMARNEKYVHNARVRVKVLRQQYAQRVAGETGQAVESADVIVLPDAAAPSAVQARAAA